MRQVLGITDLIPGPEVIVPAMRGDAGPKIEKRHAAIVNTPACQLANEQVAEMMRKEFGRMEPEFKNMKEALHAASEWKCWYDEEVAAAA